MHRKLEIPKDIAQAMHEGGSLTTCQLRELIRCEAAALGLSFDEAMKLAKHRQLPGCPIGSDLQLLSLMLE